MKRTLVFTRIIIQETRKDVYLPSHATYEDIEDITNEMYAAMVEGGNERFDTDVNEITEARIFDEYNREVDCFEQIFDKSTNLPYNRKYEAANPFSAS